MVRRVAVTSHRRERRRLALAAIALAPLFVRAQAGGRRRVAFVGFPALFEGANGLDAVAKSLAARGYADGGRIEVLRVVIEPREGEERGRGLAYLLPIVEQKLLALKPDVIVAIGSVMTKTTSLATRTIPIVGSAADPVALGVAESIARPGTNVTGIASSHPGIALKAMELLKSLVPKLVRIGIFHDTRTSATRYAGLFKEAARTLGIEPVMVPALTEEDLVRDLRAIPAQRIQAGVIGWLPPDSKGRFMREAAARRLPLLGMNDEEVEQGALLAYYTTGVGFAARMAAVVEHVLRGADPATLPFELPNTFGLVVNRRAAMALGITVPAALLLRADRVVD